MRKRKTHQVSFTEVGVAKSGSSKPAGGLRIGTSPGLTGIALRGRQLWRAMPVRPGEVPILSLTGLTGIALRGRQLWRFGDA